MRVTVYVVAGDCQQCKATTRYMDKLGVAYTVAPFEEHEDIQRLASELGYTQAPIVTVENNDVRMSWSGFSPTNIKGLLQR